MKARIYICQECGAPCGETCWRCWVDVCGGAAVFVAVSLLALWL